MKISRWILLRMRAVLDRCKENQNTRFMFSNVYQKSYRSSDNVKVRWSRRGYKWRQKMGHTSYMVDKQSYIHHSHAHADAPRQTHATRASALAHAHTHTQICNTYCFSTAAVVRRTGLNVTLYVHCLSCYVSFRWYILTELPRVSVRKNFVTVETVREWVLRYI